MAITESSIRNLISDYSEDLLYALDSDNFELYLVALEVIDDDSVNSGDSELLIFPVAPSSIMFLNNALATIHKTMNGIHVIDNDSFVPRPLNLSGTFGRDIKSVSAKWGSFTYKTGYGATKQLEKLVEKSRKISESTSNQYRTILYNLSFGQEFTVVVNGCKFYQNLQMNRIWQYDLDVTVVAPGDLSQYTETVFGKIATNTFMKNSGSAIKKYASNILEKI